MVGVDDGSAFQADEDMIEGESLLQSKLGFLQEFAQFEHPDEAEPEFIGSEGFLMLDEVEEGEVEVLAVYFIGEVHHAELIFQVNDGIHYFRLMWRMGTMNPGLSRVHWSTNYRVFLKLLVILSSPFLVKVLCTMEMKVLS